MSRRKIKLEDGSWRYFNANEALLMDIDDETKQELLVELKLSKIPKLIIIDGVDGVGKTTIVEKIIAKLQKNGQQVIYNKFKRRRGDDKRFEEPTKKYEWVFRKEVVQEINRRLVTYTNEDWIIVDKSPYCEYFYQRTEEFDRGLITPYGNHLIEQEIFKYKYIIDNAIVIFLESEDCWNNYYNRESKKEREGHVTSYPIMDEETYKSMVKSFKDNQHLYEDNVKYRNIQIKNDKDSWEKVFNTIKELVENE